MVDNTKEFSIKITKKNSTVSAVCDYDRKTFLAESSDLPVRFNLTENVKEAVSRVMQLVERYEREAREALKFSLDNFKQGKVAVHCHTKEEIELFMVYLHAKGHTWGLASSLLEIDCHEGACYYGNCFSAAGKQVTFITKKGLEQYYPGTPIIDFDKSMLE